MKRLTTAQRLGIVLALNVSLAALLAIIGVAANSFGVVAEMADYLADAAAIAVSLWAIRLSRRSAGDEVHRFKLPATKLVALLNSGWLFVLSLIIVGGAAVRLVTSQPRVQGLAVLIASGIAALVMLAGVVILQGSAAAERTEDLKAADERLSLRAVLLDTASDALSAAGVAASGAFIFFTGGNYWADPVVAIAISIIVAYRAAGLFGEVVRSKRTTFFED